MADSTDAAAPAQRPRDVRDSDWFQVVMLVVLIGGFVLLVGHFLRHDVVTNWKLLATCPSTADATPVPVATTVNTQSCTSDPLDPIDGRGWPIVAFVLPTDVGLTPSITTVHSDKSSHRMLLDYTAAAPGDGRNSSETVLAFIEVPSDALPDVPFTVQGATGSITVTTVPGS